ncbi:MAG: hypothetical protein K5770_08070 [Lachnospiraceae bacterium]|nr:hypothetical protein [Lachnospiraceae bacterium]
MSEKDAWNLVWETIKDRYGFPEPDYFPDKDDFHPSLHTGEIPDFIEYTGNAMMVYDYDRENEF